jgi:hydroxyacylglutathione hydrolase
MKINETDFKNLSFRPNPRKLHSSDIMYFNIFKFNRKVSYQMTTLQNQRTIAPWIRVLALFMSSLAILLLSGCSPAADVAAPEIVSGVIDADQYSQRFLDGEDHLLIDVRTPEEYASGHIPGAINISIQTLPDHLSEIPQDETIVVYCRSGNRSAAATDILVDAGYAPVYDLGGIQDWVSAGYPVEY